MMQEKIELTANVIEKLNKNLEKKKVEWIVKIMKVDFLQDRFFCIVKDGTENFFKCIVPISITQKFESGIMSPGQCIKIKDYGVFRYSCESFKEKYTGTKKFIFVMAVVDFEVAKPTLKKAEENPPLPSTSGEKPPLPSNFERKPAPLPVYKSVVPQNKSQPVRTVNPSQQINPNFQNQPKIDVKHIEDTIKMNSIRNISAQMNKVLYGTLHFYPDSLRDKDRLYMVINDDTRAMVCWVHGWIKNLFIKKMKDGLKIRIKNFTVRHVTMRINRFPQYRFEMVINSTTDFHVYDDNKPVLVHLFDQSIIFKLDPYVQVRPHRYRTLMDIVDSNSMQPISFIGVIVDQTYVIQTRTVTVKRVSIQDETGLVDIVLWKNDGENFSIPVGQIIVGHNFSVEKRYKWNFTPCYRGHTLTVAPKSPDEFRLQQWVTSLYSSAKRPIYFDEHEDSDEEKVKTKLVQSTKSIKSKKSKNKVKKKQQTRNPEKKIKRQLKIQRRLQRKEEYYRQCEIKERLEIEEELDYLKEVKKKMEKMANYYVQTDGHFDLRARKRFKTWALPPEVIPAEELPRIVEKNKKKKFD